MKIRVILFCLFILGIIPFDSFTQDISARISVINGGRVFFPFTSLRDFENGMTLTNYTTIGLTVVDNDPGGGGTGAPDVITNFQVTVESVSSAAGDLVGDSGANLDADYIEIRPSNNLGLGTAGETYTNVTLSGASQTILNSTQVEAAWDTHQINITFVCNPTEPGGGSLFGEVPDYYTTTLAFDLDVFFVP